MEQKREHWAPDSNDGDAESRRMATSPVQRTLGRREQKTGSDLARLFSHFSAGVVDGGCLCMVACSYE